MPDEKSSKWVEAIVKLTRMTQDGGLEWAVAEIQMPADKDVRPDTAYTSTFKGHRLKISKVSVRSSDVWSIPSTSSLFANVSAPKDYWNPEVVLSLIDAAENRLWDFPHVEGLSGLYKAVQFQVAKVSDFLENLQHQK